MISYTTVGTNDLEKAIAFYDGIFSEVGFSKAWGSDRMQGWTSKQGAPMFAVCTPWDKQPATAGNGTMIALDMKSKEAVDKLHAKAIELGAFDDGAPGPRNEVFYCGYFKDADGNKINAFCYNK